MRGDKVGDRRHVVNGRDAVARAPDVLPDPRVGVDQARSCRGFFGGRVARSMPFLAIDGIRKFREHARETIRVDEVLDRAVDDHAACRRPAPATPASRGSACRCRRGPRRALRRHGSGSRPDTLPPSTRQPSQNSRISRTSENWLCVEGVSARPAADHDQAVRAGFRGLARVLGVDDVAQHRAAIAMHRLDHLAGMAEARDDQRHLVLHDDLEVRLVARIGAVNDEVHAMRRHARVSGWRPCRPQDRSRLR